MRRCRERRLAVFLGRAIGTSAESFVGTPHRRPPATGRYYTGRPPQPPCAVSELNRLILDNLAAVVLALSGVLLILLVLFAVQAVRLSRAARAYRTLVAGQEGGSLQGVLDGHIGQVHDVGDRLSQLNQLYERLELRSRGSLQHIGLVRFNPFEDTGSDQSFAIALLDERHDGIVLSSLHGRTNTRLFAKPVENGESRHALSDEESQAIRIAVQGTAEVASAH
jgi:hypothetical protein